jgi:transcriptional regulator of aromatic amino acid metabolism
MIFNLLGISTLNKKLKELEDKNYAQYCENHRLKKELEAKELDLKIAQMYIDDDDALLELLELSKSKPNVDDQYRGTAMGMVLGLHNAASQQALAAQNRAQQQTMGSQLGSLNVWGGI